MVQRLTIRQWSTAMKSIELDSEGNVVDWKMRTGARCDRIGCGTALKTEASDPASVTEASDQSPMEATLVRITLAKGRKSKRADLLFCKACAEEIASRRGSHRLKILKGITRKKL
jgi:hypothetical protein